MMRAATGIRQCALVATAAFLTATALPAQSIISTFTDYDAFECGTGDADASECWGHVGDSGSSLQWIESGSGDGYLRMNEAGTGQWDWFVAPDKFLGDRSAFFGGIFSFAINPSRVTGTRGTSETAAVVLQSGGTGIGFFLDSQPTAGTWNAFSAALSSSGNWFVGTPEANNIFGLSGKVAATDAQIADVLSNLTDLWILGDWASGSLQVGLDDVVLAQAPAQPTPVPAPAPLALLGMGLFGLLLRTARTNRHA
jgi:hypothetical protein